MMFALKIVYTQKILILPCLFLLAAGIACTFDMGVLEPTPIPSIDIAHDDPGHDLAAGLEIEELDEAQPSPSEAGTGCQEARQAGLVFSYRDQNGRSLSQVGNCGGLIHLLDQSDVQISTDGERALYTCDDDIWIVKLPFGAPRNLTQTPDRIEVNPQWWTGQDDLVVFGSWRSVEDTGPTSGHLSVISIDRGDYRVLVDQPSNSSPAPKPGGNIIAYDLGDAAWFYHLDMDESELFDVNLYGLNIRKGMKIGSPSWSPDGRKLAWWASGVFSSSTNGSVALAIFDLENGSVELLHPYTPAGIGGWLPRPIWSPDGTQLAVVTLGEAHKADLWVIDAESGEEHLLGFASNPVWHPDGSALVYQAWSDDVIKLVEVGSWNLLTLDLPPGSTPTAWPEIILDFPSE